MDLVYIKNWIGIFKERGWVSGDVWVCSLFPILSLDLLVPLPFFLKKKYEHEHEHEYKYKYEHEHKDRNEHEHEHEDKNENKERISMSTNISKIIRPSMKTKISNISSFSSS